MLAVQACEVRVNLGELTGGADRPLEYGGVSAGVRAELRAVLLSDMRVRKFDKFECPTGCSVTSASVHGDPMFKVNGIAAGAKDELA